MGGVVTGATLAGRLMGHLRRYKRPPIVGLALATAGLLLLTWRPTSLSLLTVELIFVVVGVGMGAVLPVTTMAIQNAVELHQLGTATGTMNFFRSLGVRLPWRSSEPSSWVGSSLPVPIRRIWLRSAEVAILPAPFTAFSSPRPWASRSALPRSSPWRNGRCVVARRLREMAPRWSRRRLADELSTLLSRLWAGSGTTRAWKWLILGVT
jgi:Major Facilitator Superfamily